mmetsp:Transcript_32834/g.45823  ORF Transcript_32834/g.45823 Transcript_32834/m.45823 type:complete len:106 (-) Transcript_32834:90-407(-)
MLHTLALLVQEQLLISIQVIHHKQLLTHLKDNLYQQLQLLLIQQQQQPQQQQQQQRTPHTEHSQQQRRHLKGAIHLRAPPILLLPNLDNPLRRRRQGYMKHQSLS